MLKYSTKIIKHLIGTTGKGIKGYSGLLRWGANQKPEDHMLHLLHNAIIHNYILILDKILT